MGRHVRMLAVWQQLGWARHGKALLSGDGLPCQCRSSGPASGEGEAVATDARVQIGKSVHACGAHMLEASREKGMLTATSMEQTRLHITRNRLEISCPCIPSQFEVMIRSCT